MNNEIKEILDKLQRVANRETASYNALIEMKDADYRLLLDYITNLQEELQAYKQERENILDKSKRLNYKSRIDKAIQYINWNYNHYRLSKVFNDKILNILQGSDKE